MNHHITPAPGPECARYADILPLLDGRFDALAAEARQHLADCAHCQDQQRIYRRLDAALRTAYGAPAIPHIFTEDIMASLPDDDMQPAAAPVTARQRVPAPRRIIPRLTAALSVALLAALAFAVFANHPRATKTATAQPAATATPHIYPGFPGTLYSISMLSSTDGWAVGQSIFNSANGSTPLFCHDVNGTWQQVSLDLHISPDALASLTGISMVNDQDGWAVGSIDGQALIMHYDGTTWQQVASPTNAPLGGVQMLSADDGWIYSSETITTPPFFLHYTNHAWKQVSIAGLDGVIPSGPRPQTQTGGVFSLAFVSPQEAWASGVVDGMQQADDIAVFFHYLNGQWSVAQTVPHTYLWRMAMASSQDGWAVALRLTSSNPPNDVYTAFHYQNGTWKEDTSLLQPGEEFGPLVFSSPGNGWANAGMLVGKLKLYHYDGIKWQPLVVTFPEAVGSQSVVIDNFTTSPDRSVWGVLGVNTGGSKNVAFIVHYVNGTWQIVGG